MLSKIGALLKAVAAKLLPFLKAEAANPAVQQSLAAVGTGAIIAADPSLAPVAPIITAGIDDLLAKVAPQPAPAVAPASAPAPAAPLAIAPSAPAPSPAPLPPAPPKA